MPEGRDPNDDATTTNEVRAGAKDGIRDRARGR